MRKMDSKDVLDAFEVLANEKHHASVFRASERIRQHVLALEAEVVQARNDALIEAAVLLRDLARSALRALTSRSAQEASPDTTGEADQPLPCGPVEMASEENGLLPAQKKKRQARMPPCGHARCEVLPSGEEAHVATCPNFGTR